MRILACPTCAAPADVVPHPSAGDAHPAGEHVIVTCVVGHWFLTPQDLLPDAEQPPATAPPAAA